MSTVGRVVRVGSAWKFDTGAHFAEVSCPHQEHGACGGCYARLFFTVLAIEQQPESAAQYVARAFREMKRDKS